MLVARRGGIGPRDGDETIRLRPLMGNGDGVTYRFGVGQDATGDVFTLVHQTRGRWQGPFRYGISADWRVAVDGGVDAFISSRIALFRLRVEHIGAFHTDYLLRRCDDPSRLTVLGLYGDENGLQLARNHPAIRDWAADNPPSALGASDETGVLLFGVVD